MTRLLFDIAGKTDPGCVRENNEDSLAVDEQLGLMVVADGMGGHNSGEVASRIATETIRDLARKMLGGEKRIVPEGGDPGLSPQARQLEFIVRTANASIYEKSRAAPQYQGMGTTVVAVLTGGGIATIAHVGDSRAYVLRNGRLQVLTQDHSLVMDQVRRGLITLEEAERSNLQNILTRALGTEEQVVVDVQEHPLLPGDVLLLCTDGLTKMVSERDIARMAREARGPLEACDSLIAAARDRGGADNVTVVAACVSSGGAVQGILKRIFGK